MPRKPKPKSKPKATPKPRARTGHVQPLSTDGKVLADFRRRTAATPTKQKQP